MGADNKRPLGPSSDPGLPNTVYDRTGTNAYSSQHVYHSRGSKPDRSRSSGTTCKTSSSFCFKKFSKHSGFHQLPFRSSQEGWGSPASNKPKTLEHFPALRTLQNGVNKHAKRSSKKRRLFSENRLKGCISDSAGLEGTPKVPSISLEGLPPGVRLPPLWSGECSTSIHQTNETSFINFETERYPPHSLSGRLSNYGGNTATYPATCSNNTKSTGRIGVCNKLPQVPSSTLSRNRIFGMHSKFSQPKFESPKGQNKESPSKLSETTSKPCGYGSQTSKILGPTVLLNPGSIPCSTTLSLPPTCKEHSSETSKVIRSPGQSRHRGSSGGSVVEGQPSCMEWKGPSPSVDGPHHRDRCIPSRLGGPLPGHFNRGAMVSKGKHVSYKLFRTASRVPGCQMFYQIQSESPGTLINGQCYRSNIHKQNGGNPLSPSLPASQGPVGLVPEPQCISKSSVPPRGTKRACRSRIQSISRLQRLEVGHENFQQTVSKVGSFKRRPLCISFNISARPVCELETRSPSCTYRCFHSELGDIQGLRFPSIRTDRSLPSTGSESEGGAPSVGGSSLASPNMVPSLTRALCRLSAPPADATKSVDTTGQKSSSSSTTTSWVASIDSGLQTEGISEQTRKILLAAWRPNTTSSYSSAWHIWHSWCAKRITVNPLSPSLNNILDFFTSQFHEGKEYRTINVYRSALSTILPLLDGQKVGRHPLVCQLLKGVYQLRPPQPRYAKTWQVGKLVQFIGSLGPNEKLSTKLLSYKLVGLLALTAPDRASGLAARDLRFRFILPEGVEFKLPELTKNVKQGESLKCCFHASFPQNALLCVCKCLAEYECRTLEWRPTDPSKPNQLLLSYITPHKPVSSATVARWLKELMQLAGIDTSLFKGHSIRGAVTTEAARQGFSIPDILQFADWSQQSTFIKFYYRPQFNPSAGRAVLSSNVHLL